MQLGVGAPNKDMKVSLLVLMKTLPGEQGDVVVNCGPASCGVSVTTTSPVFRPSQAGVPRFWPI
jgi:hypothetical protein